RLDANGVATHRRKARRSRAQQARHQPQIVSQPTHRSHPQHRENSALTAEHSLIASKSARRHEMQYSESRPTWARIASRLQPEFRRLNELPSAATAALRAFFYLFEI